MKCFLCDSFQINDFYYFLFLGQRRRHGLSPGARLLAPSPFSSINIMISLIRLIVCFPPSGISQPFSGLLRPFLDSDPRAFWRWPSWPAATTHVDEAGKVAPPGGHNAITNHMSPAAHCVKPGGIINRLKIVTEETTQIHFREMGGKSEKRDLVAGPGSVSNGSIFP